MNGSNPPRQVTAGDPKAGRPPTTSVIRVLDATGDTSVQWDRERLASGDPEALAAVAEAERLFAEARAKGAQAFRVGADEPPQRLERFDPQAKETLVIPPMVGG